jgi:DNA repair exonuclease SbcCD nuclease subunit
MNIKQLDTDEVNIVYTTDWHFSDKPIGRRQDNYRKALFNKLEFVRKLTQEVNGIALCGGDVFHVKSPRSEANSFDLLVTLIHALRRFPTAGVWGTVGNHDISFDRMDSLSSQPLGLLIATHVYRDISIEPVTFVNKDGSIAVQVESFPYEDGEKTLERLLASGPRSGTTGVTNYRVGIVHAYGTPGGKAQMFAARKIGYDEIKHLDYDLLLWGHDHSRHETETVGNITHINLGSLARAAYAYDEVSRPVVATLLSFSLEGVDYEEREIPVTPIAAAFVTADKGVQQVVKTEDVEDFFTSMDDVVGGIESGDPREVMAQLCEGEPVLLSRTLELCGL